MNTLRTLWIILYHFPNDEEITITIFDNEENFKKCYDHCYKHTNYYNEPEKYISYDICSTIIPEDQEYVYVISNKLLDEVYRIYKDEQEAKEQFEFLKEIGDFYQYDKVKIYHTFTIIKEE